MKDKEQMLDKSWKEKFNEIALEQGKERYMGKRVADLKKNGDHYSAGILGRERRNVSLVLKDGKPIRMICFGCFLSLLLCWRF